MKRKRFIKLCMAKGMEPRFAREAARRVISVHREFDVKNEALPPCAVMTKTLRIATGGTYSFVYFLIGFGRNM